jgi:hypothetical protein
VRARAPLRTAAASLAAAVVLTVWATWPLATCLDTCVADPGPGAGLAGLAFGRDVDLVVWILAWGAHALVHRPAAFFDANVFHPAPLALTTTESLLGLQPLYLPIAAVAGDPLVAHQATLLATFAGAFLTMLALVRAWTGSWLAGATAGVLYAFGPFRMLLPALQIEAAWLLPLVVLACERVGAGGGWRWRTCLAASIALQALASYYVGYATFAAVATMLPVALAWRGARQHAVPLLGAVALAAAAVVACSLPYLAARAGGTLAPPDPAFVAAASARPGRTGATLALLLALATAPWWRRGLVGAAGAWLVAVGVAGVIAHLLALGPRIDVGGTALPGPFAIVSALVPGWSLVRAPIRLNLMATLAAAVYAGVGVAGAARALAGRSRTLASGVLAGAFALAVVAVPLTARWPLPVARLPRAERPPVYDWLARAPAGPVLELPLHDFASTQAHLDVEARRLRLSARHWQPLLGGYSGYAPPSYAPVSALARALPDARALRLLQRTTGVRWIVLHRAELGRDAKRRWRAARADMRPVAVLGADVVVAPRERVLPDLTAALLRDDAVTPLGTPRTPLAAADRRVTVTLEAALPRVPWLTRTELAVRVTNSGGAPWPGMGGRARGLVTLAYRWLADDGRAIDERTDAGRLPWDVAPGESVVGRLVVRAPAGSGAARLVVGVAQDGAWLDGTTSLCFGPTGGPIACPAAAGATSSRRLEDAGRGRAAGSRAASSRCTASP